MRKLLLLCLFVCFSQLSVFSQNAIVVAPNGLNIAQPSSIGMHTKNSSADQSEYFGYDNQIKNICVDNIIPEKLPTKEGYSDKMNYKNVVNEWLKAHSVFVKPEFLTTLIQN
jgi:hypothetical protein